LNTESTSLLEIVEHEILVQEPCCGVQHLVYPLDMPFGHSCHSTIADSTGTLDAANMLVNNVGHVALLTRLPGADLPPTQRACSWHVTLERRFFKRYLVDT
jgi:hypothetical protein